jgi:curved DNA-binding protein CbpA
MKNILSQVLSNPEKRRQYDASLGTRPGEGSAAQALRGATSPVKMDENGMSRFNG